MKVTGGKSVYGASVGILMLETTFPRIPGDIGNTASFPFPVHYKVVRGATADRVVRKHSEGLLDTFIDAAKELEADGADGITTTCGFLILLQKELAAAVSVPVLSSSLMQVDLVNSMLPAGKRAGILTISGSSLTEDHIVKAKIPAGTPVGSTEGGREFTNAVLNDHLEMDVAAARQDNVDAARDLVAKHPDIGALILECTNMSPFAADIREATGLPVFSILTLVQWFQAGLVPRRF